MQQECKRRAAAKQQVSTSAEPQTPSDLEKPSFSDSGLGLCGLGDMNQPIAQSVFDPVSNKKSFVKSMHKQWVEDHSERVSSHELPENRAKTVCGEFCLQSMLPPDEPDFPKLVCSARNLLQNICRSTKPMVAQFNKQLDGSCRHPILLARSVSAEGNTLRTSGWLITIATFKPLRVEGIVLSLPESGLVPPFTLEVKCENVYKSSLTTFQFSSMERMTFEVAQLLDQAKSVEYCFNVPYTIAWRTSLTTLVVTADLTWTPVRLNDSNDGSDGDDGAQAGDDEAVDEGQDEEADINEILSLESGLSGQSKEVQSSNSQKQQSKQRAQTTQPVKRTRRRKDDSVLSEQ